MAIFRKEFSSPIEIRVVDRCFNIQNGQRVVRITEMIIFNIQKAK